MLQRLAIGQPIDSVRYAILRESALCAQAWQQCIEQPARAVLDVLSCEQRLARQLGALFIVADAKLYRRLADSLADAALDQGAAFVAGATLLQQQRASCEAVVFEQWWRAEVGPKQSGLGRALALCGVRAGAHTAKLAGALTSHEPRVVQRAAGLVARLGPLRAWPMPHGTHPEGLCAALELMGLGYIAPEARVFSRAAQHHDPQVHQALGRAQSLLYPKAALAHCRTLAHRGRDVSAGTLRLLGLLHDKADAGASRDFSLLQTLCREPNSADAALVALGLAGRHEAAQTCLEAAHRDNGLVGPAARSLQAIFGVDDEFWARFGEDDGETTAQSLERGLRAHAAAAPNNETSDFQPRTQAALVLRLRGGDMAHLRARADECHMRSQGSARLHPWAYISPQLAGEAPLGADATAPIAVSAERSYGPQRRAP